MINEIFEKFRKYSKRELAILWFFALALNFLLIILATKQKLPLGKGDFIFFAILALLAALYRPRWIFFLIVSTVSLENIILASGFLPLQLRPFQFLMVIMVFAIAILLASGRLKFRLQKPGFIDWLIFSLVPLSFLSLVNSPSKPISLKQNFVLLSFVVLYYLARNFIHGRRDIIKTFFFFGVSCFATVTFGFYQVFADKSGGNSFEVMFGRPNATFTEADWLGIFLSFSFAVIFSAIFYAGSKEFYATAIKKMALTLGYFLIFICITLSILTLSRSAWLGSLAVLFFFGLISFFEKNRDGAKMKFKNGISKVAVLLFIILVSIAAIRLIGLSKFDIFDRARSTATNEQKITISCEVDAKIAGEIKDTAELAKYGCRHINLEEIEGEKNKGRLVSEIFRKDPNILTRETIYEKSWNIVREHFVLGVGFGTITQKLGADPRGAGLNESNIFLQVWAGSGILGLIAFVCALGYLFVHSFRRISPICPLNRIIGCPIVKDNLERALHLFVILGLIALIIPNLFNAGLFMGIFWLALGVMGNVLDFITQDRK